MRKAGGLRRSRIAKLIFDKANRVNLILQVLTLIPLVSVYASPRLCQKKVRDSQEAALDGNVVNDSDTVDLSSRRA